MPSSNNKRDSLVIAQMHADVIWRAAWLSLISMSHAMYHEQTCFAIVAGGVMLPL
jgi:hypothetical protein